MTTENQTTSIEPKLPKNHQDELRKLSSLEERKGNAVKPLSLRPNRSIKKNISLKPLALRSR